MCDNTDCTHGAVKRGWDAVGRFFGAWGHSDKSATATQNRVVASDAKIISIDEEYSQPQGGYPGQALEELAVKGIEMLGEQITQSDVSPETANDINLGLSILAVGISKAKNPGADKNLIKNIAAKIGGNFLKFGGDEAVVHFGKHANQIMKVTGKSTYNLKNYVDDANWIIQNGTYSSKLNGYYSFMANGSKGQSLFGFVGMKNAGSTISTFHIKSAAQLGLK